MDPDHSRIQTFWIRPGSGSGSGSGAPLFYIDDVKQTDAHVGAGDVIDAAMTDVADIAAAGEPVPRDHGSDVIMELSSPTPHDVVKAEVVDCTVDARSGLDGDAAEQRRLGSRDHSTAVSVDDDGASHWSTFAKVVVK